LAVAVAVAAVIIIMAAMAVVVATFIHTTNNLTLKAVEAVLGLGLVSVPI
jgi:hypothetical protein